MANLALKKALIDREIPIYKTALEAGIHPNRLSRFISGLSEARDDEKEKLSELAGKPIIELFPKTVGAESVHV
jgi:hypothetical protein